MSDALPTAVRLGSRLVLAAALTVPLAALLAAPLAAQGAPGPLQAPPSPAQNPTTAAKSVLGKLLFWDEQLSSDNTVACGTCHLNELGGSDLRNAIHPGNDELFGTPDDVFGSFGVVRSNAANEYARDGLFDLDPQVTGRWAPTTLAAAYFDELFWDGRATSAFVDPESGALSIPSGGALESQVVGPPLSDVEMAHEARDWSQITAKLAAVRPLALASDLPPDIQAALAVDRTYPELFDAAFGDARISAERIAFAIASYERTLVPDQTPWDAFVAGDPTALTPQQAAGLNVFNGPGRCDLCHVPPLFSDGLFRNVGLRPPFQDIGRQAVTGNPADRGKFKVPTLRNAGLRRGFFHTGQFTTVQQVITFYNGGGNVPFNQDPLMQPLGLNPQQRNNLANFVVNGLTDPRVAQRLPPFDRPTLHGESRVADPTVFGAASAGAGGTSPAILGNPAAVANPDFKIGLADALGGSVALLVVSLADLDPALVVQGIPLNVDLALAVSQTIHFTSGSGPGDGLATFVAGMPSDPGLIGLPFFAQWLVLDGAAAGGLAASPGAAFTAR